MQKFELFIVKGNIDPFSSSEVPVLYFAKRPTRDEVWEQYVKHFNWRACETLEENWDWNYSVKVLTEADVIDNTEQQ